MSDEFVLDDPIETKTSHHRRTSSVRIPPDIYSHMIEAQIVPPAIGTVSFEWDEKEKKIKITIWDPNKPKDERKKILWTKGKDSFRSAKLHYRKGNLVRVCRK